MEQLKAQFLKARTTMYILGLYRKSYVNKYGSCNLCSKAPGMCAECTNETIKVYDKQNLVELEFTATELKTELGNRPHIKSKGESKAERISNIKESRGNGHKSNRR